MSNMNIVLGIDIGGTNTSFGFVDRAGTIIAETSMETKTDDSAENFVSRLYHRIEEVRMDLPSLHNLCGIGIGAPNANYYRGTIEQAVHLNWGKTVNFVGLIRTLLQYTRLHHQRRECRCYRRDAFRQRPRDEKLYGYYPGYWFR